jgi:hypothetical protein
VGKREHSRASTPAWPAAAAWTRWRDLLVVLYLVFLFHDIFIRLLGSQFLPLVIGVRLPPVPWRDAVVLALLLVGLWRMAVDPAWRRRFRVSHMWWQVALLLFAAAFLCLHATSLARLNEIKGLLYPMILFGAGVLAGYDWRKARNTIIALALVNIAAAVIVGLFFMEQYQLWIAAYRTIFGEGTALSFGKFEEIVVLPKPLILERTSFTVLYIVAAVVAFHELLFSAAKRRWRLFYGACCAASVFLVIASFSRAGIATMFLILLGLYAAWSMQRAQAQGLRAARGLLALVPAALILLVVGLLAVVLAYRVYGIELLDPSNLISSGREGRITIWSRVIDDIDRQHGWLTGITPTFRTERASFVFGANGGSAWSEWSYYTVDNAYLHMIMYGGLFALAGLLAFLAVAAWQLYRYSCYLPLAMLVSTSLVWWMLATNPMLISLVLLLGGGQLGNLMLRAPAAEPVPAKLGTAALPAST